MRREIFYHLVRDQVVESDYITCTQAEWDAWPGSQDPGWAVFRHGRKIRANRILIPTALLGSHSRSDQPARSLDCEPSRN
jgi:hypothetical protein